jgi:putative protease
LTLTPATQKLPFQPGLAGRDKKVSHREYTTGFLFGNPGASGQHYGGEIYRRSHVFAGLVRGYDHAAGMTVVEQRNRFAVGDDVEIMIPRGETFRQKITEIIDEEGNSVEAAPHPQQIVKVPFDRPVPDYAILRKI